ncbi:MAG: MATE family efflux transporter, partial [Eubacterium sp.]|nr:MATE family efflux transporter [Candidatus Colimonas fimequi]
MAKKSSSAELALKGHMTTGQLIKFVLPTVITVVFATLYGIIDGIFVSNVGGNDAFAAINLITPLFLIFSSFGMMFGTGGNALVSKTRGEGKEREAQEIFSTLTFAVIILGIIITVFLELYLEDILLIL